jgi:hypothetical protein
MPISRAGEEKLAREAREEELAKKELAREKSLPGRRSLPSSLERAERCSSAISSV